MSIEALLSELSEGIIARRVAILHDEARLAYRLRANTVKTWPEFEDTIAGYVQHHYARCVTGGGRIDRSQAAGRAKEIINQVYHRQGGDTRSAFRDCQEGVNGGLRGILDILCDSIKEEAVQYYSRAVFDRYLPPDDWPRQKEMVAQFIRHCGVALPGIDRSDPGRYARDLETLVTAFVRSLKQTSTIFRKL